MGEWFEKEVQGSGGAVQAHAEAQGGGRPCLAQVGAFIQGRGDAADGLGIKVVRARGCRWESVQSWRRKAVAALCKLMQRLKVVTEFNLHR